MGDEVLEIGPGLGATTRWLAKKVPKLTVLELEEGYCERLRAELGSVVRVVQGDASSLPFETASFSSAVCVTMLHHLPSPSVQDRAFAEVARVLTPGGSFAGTDSIGTGPLFKLIHVGDILNVIDPDGLPQRLEAAGLTDVQGVRSGNSFRFRARKPG